MYKRYFKSDKRLDAIFTDRLGGFSKNPYNSLNVGLNSGDDCEIVKQNRDLVFNDLGHSSFSVAYADQCHGDRVSLVESADIYRKSDALITNKKNLPLVIQVADCAAVYLYDEKNQAIGLVHSGWRGTQAKIVSKSAQAMKKQFSSDVSRLQARISPCLSQTHFEVGEDVYKLFDSSYFQEGNNGKWLFDMKQVLLNELAELGIDSIKYDLECTFKQDKRYFSYRRDGKNSGRMMGVFILK